ncbi:MAG: tetratricopeptide repeat protein [Opitutaceae bacterium]|nr:tetratricopeptide repeat protein [Opitutaceae bacterium]
MTEVAVSSLDPRVQKQLESAQNALQKGNFDYVADVTARVLKLNPGCLPVRRLQRAALLRKAGPRGKAERAVLGFFGKAKAAFARKGTPQATLEAADALLAADPRNTAALRLLAEAAAELGMKGTAIFAREAELEETPGDAAALLALGEAYYEGGRAKDALRMADEILKTKPQDGAALKLMRKAAIAQTTEKGNWEEAGSFREKLKDETEAVSLEQASKMVASEEMTERLLAEAVRRAGEQPDNVTHHRAVIDLLRRQGRVEEALEWVAKARATAAGGADAGLERAEGDLRAALLKREVAAVEEEARARPGDAAVALRLKAAEGRLRAFQLAEAKAFAERYPNDHGARFALAELLFKEGEYEQAIANYQQAQKSPKVRLQALSGMGRAFKARRMFDLAVAQFQAAKGEMGLMDDLKKEVIYELASCFEAMGRKEEAIGEYKVIYSDDIGFRDVAAKINAYYAGR